MTKAKTPDVAPDLDESSPSVGLNLAAVAAALIGYGQAVAAVARFPSSPVPPSLVDRIGAAEDALRAAVEDLPAAVAVSATAEAYDDAWIRTEFSDLQKGLGDKFAALRDAEQAQAEADKAEKKAAAVALDDLRKEIAALRDQVSAIKAAPAAAPAKD